MQRFPWCSKKMGEQSLNKGRRKGRGQMSDCNSANCMPNRNLLFFRSYGVLELSGAHPSCWALPAESHNLTWMCSVYDAAGRNNVGFKRVSETLIIFFWTKQHTRQVWKPCLLLTIWEHLDDLLLSIILIRRPWAVTELIHRGWKSSQKWLFSPKEWLFHSYSLTNTGLMSVVQTRGEKLLMRWGWQGLVQLMYPISAGLCSSPFCIYCWALWVCRMISGALSDQYTVEVPLWRACSDMILPCQWFFSQFIAFLNI